MTDFELKMVVTEDSFNFHPMNDFRKIIKSQRIKLTLRISSYSA